MQADAEFYKAMDGARTHLLFFVSMFWLSLATWMVWLPISLAHPSWMFLGVAVVGPFACWTSYALAQRSYDGFATAFRTGIDTFRFGLLSSLHMNLPANLREERHTWDLLQRLIGYGEESPISYKHGVE